MSPIRIPVLVKHTTIAIYKTGHIVAKTKEDRFRQALEIAKAQLERYGYITNGTKVDDIGLTAKGRKRELKHRGEGAGKTTLFDTLYRQFDIGGDRAKEEEKEQEKKEKIRAEQKPLSAAEQAKADRAQERGATIGRTVTRMDRR